MRFKTLFLTLAFLGLLALPLLARGQETHSVAFDGISFSFDDAVAENVNISQFAGDPVEGAGPGFSNAAHIQFNIGYLPAAPDSYFDALGGIRVYKMADIAQYDFLQAQAEQLQALIDEQADLSAYEVPLSDSSNVQLPFIPLLTHAQVLRARAHYIETDALKGIAYVNYVTAAGEPLMNTSFWYAVQAISNDGQYYVSANFRPTTDLFPSELAADFDPETFYAEMDAYLTESIATLNAAEPTDFTPSLDSFDAIIESMQFAG